MKPRDTRAFGSPEEIDAALRELDLPDDEVSALAPVIESLEAWRAPVPTATETSFFLAQLEDRIGDRLDGSLAHTTAASSRPASFSRSHIALLWRIACWQPRLIHRSVWAGSLVAMVCALCVTWLGLTRQDIALGLFVPVIVATCASFLYGPEVDPSLEGVRATPVSLRFLLASRLVALLGYELALGLATTAALALHEHESFGALVMLWLGPTALLSSCSLLLSLLLGPLVATGSMFAVWFTQFVELDRELGGVLLTNPRWQTSPLLFGGAFVILLLGFWLFPSQRQRVLPGVLPLENQL
ncbi:MAG TPA: hypothetical protein VFU63_01165 [Ktedonobacterales bacterium]|nr:hypothetical protein [Ktedonobacterales bacterium]